MKNCTIGRRCSRSIGVLRTNCFQLRSDQDRKGRTWGSCLRQRETALPGPGAHIPTSIHTCPFPGMPGMWLSLASGATHGNMVHSHQLFQNTWMDEKETTTHKRYMCNSTSMQDLSREVDLSPQHPQAAARKHPGSLQDNPGSSVMSFPVVL